MQTVDTHKVETEIKNKYRWSEGCISSSSQGN